MSIAQTPDVQLPPELPVIVSTGVPDWVPAVAIASLIVVAVLLLPLVRALGRRLERPRVDESLRGELDQLYERVSALEAVEDRLQELENRVEFSERLLARQAGPDARREVP